MKILVLNCGSSSLKYQLIDMENEAVLCIGLVERIGIEGSILTQKKDGVEGKYVKEQPMKDHQDAIKLVLEGVLDSTYGGVKDMAEIDAVGHRVVHGGEKFASSVIITEEVEEAIRKCSELAPLHNPANLMGIDAIKAIIPGVPNVAVFDTAFHQTMPASSYLYGLPHRLYTEYGVRRYGFHGTSHKYVSQRAAEMLGKDIADLKIITCHLGNGASVAAVDGGKVVDTSMGLTPLEGLVMGTRSGDIDPAIMEFIAKKENLDIEGVMEVLNKKSGVFGISGGLSSDFRDLTDAMNAGDKKAKIAMDVFSYRVAKYIGSYAAAMNGVDDIVFTAGIGENDDYVRQEVCKYLGYLGVDFDFEVNTGLRGKEAELTKEGSKVKVFVIPTNEELAIARETLALVK